MSTAAWEDMTKAEQELVTGYMRRSDISDIRRLGAGALEVEREKEALQERRQAWVTKLGLACFKCGGTVCDWAAGGKNAWGRPYVICTTCVRKPR